MCACAWCAHQPNLRTLEVVRATARVDGSLRSMIIHIYVHTYYVHIYVYTHVYYAHIYVNLYYVRGMNVCACMLYNRNTDMIEILPERGMCRN